MAFTMLSILNQILNKLYDSYRTNQYRSTAPTAPAIRDRIHEIVSLVERLRDDLEVLA